jgi:hypothetical protein
VQTDPNQDQQGEKKCCANKFTPIS